MLFGQENTDRFTVVTGVRQFDVLSPLFFNILLYMIECGIECVGWKRLRDLEYEDDICLLIRDMEEMEVIIDTIVFEGSKVGVTINTAKIELTKIRE